MIPLISYLINIIDRVAGYYQQIGYETIRDSASLTQVT